MIFFLSCVTIPQLSYELGRLSNEVNVLLHSLTRVKTILSAEIEHQNFETIFNGCTNTCQYASDDVCDDGGLGSTLSYCDYGSDCFDCDKRPETELACSNTCITANDGVCQNYDCEFGTDCADCGPLSWDSMWSYSYSYDNTYDHSSGSVPYDYDSYSDENRVAHILQLK